MAQKISRGSILGRIGTGVGEGLAEQLPKEVDRHRLSSGLKQFEQDSSGLSPMQQLTRLAAIPGALEHPQLIQSFGNLARQQAKGASLTQQKEPPRPNPFPVQQETPAASPSVPSVTKREHLETIQEGFVPPTEKDIYDFAGKQFNENPGRFNNDPNEALKYSESHFNRLENRFNANEAQHKRLTDIQDNLTNRLQTHSNKLSAEVPANLYSDIEDKAINAVRPRKEGGEGLTEQEAMKKYGKELDDASRDYSALSSISGISVLGQPSDKTLRTIKNLQKDAKKRGDTENMADTLITNGNSPMMAYAQMQPVSDVPKLTAAMRAIPNLEGSDISIGTPYGKRVSAEKTLEVSKNLAKFVQEHDDASPLAIGYELKKKGYDPDVWLKYLTDNREKLNLKESQVRQLEKPDSFFPRLSDWWLSAFSGLE